MTFKTKINPSQISWTSGSHNLSLMQARNGTLLGALQPLKNPDTGKCLWIFTKADGKEVTIGPLRNQTEATKTIEYLIEDGQIDIVAFSSGVNVIDAQNFLEQIIIEYEKYRDDNSHDIKDWANQVYKGARDLLTGQQPSQVKLSTNESTDKRIES